VHAALIRSKSSKSDYGIVQVLFKAVGNAPIMKVNKYRLAASKDFQFVIQFLRKQLSYKESQSLFTYINLAFAPAPDDCVASLFKVSDICMLGNTLP
jgi:ubiquitin-like protein ATG12